MSWIDDKAKQRQEAAAEIEKQNKEREERRLKTLPHIGTVRNEVREIIEAQVPEIKQKLQSELRINEQGDFIEVSNTSDALRRAVSIHFNSDTGVITVTQRKGQQTMQPQLFHVTQDGHLERHTAVGSVPATSAELSHAALDPLT
jgi:hypothetical protein